MNTAEAKTILVTELTRYRSLPYNALQRLLSTQDAYDVVGPSGAKYQIEITAVWDNKPGGNLRVLGAVDDGGLRALAPVSHDFIVASDGAFVGE